MRGIIGYLPINALGSKPAIRTMGMQRISNLQNDLTSRCLVWDFFRSHS